MKKKDKNKFCKKFLSRISSCIMYIKDRACTDRNYRLCRSFSRKKVCVFGKKTKDGHFSKCFFTITKKKS